MRRTLRMRAWTLTLGWLVLAVAGGANPPKIHVWPAGPLEVHVSFNDVIDPEVGRRFVGTTIPFDERVRTTSEAQQRGRPADRPPYSIRIAAARWINGNTTLVLATDPHPREAVYTLTFPGRYNLTYPYDLTGVEATWDDGGDDAKPAWSVWWPVLDLIEAARLTSGSDEHAHWYLVQAKPGRLTLRTLVTLPKGKSTLRLTANEPIEANLAGEEAKIVDGPSGTKRATIRAESTGDAAVLTVTLRTGPGTKSPSLLATYQADNDPAEHPLTRDRLTLPWAPAPPSAAPPMAEPTFDLAGGDRARGEEVFRGDQAKCASCHKVRGQGGEVGPDLTGLVGKPRLEVFRDIFDPSATIRPDYLAYTVATRDGRVMVGTVRAEGASSIRLTDTDAKTVLIRRDEIEQLEPSPASIMPVGLVGVIGEEKTRDLLAYLTSAPPPEPARRP